MATPDFLNNAYNFCGDGVSGTATKNSVTNIDFKILTTDKYLHGGQLFIESAVHGDWVECQIVDIGNVLGYGANTVLRTFLYKWFIDPTNGNTTIEAPFVGKIPVNTYLRIKYHSIGTVLDVKVAINYFLSKLA